jgi:transposase
VRLSRNYRNVLSDFDIWDQKDHSESWILFPENMGENICIDETSLTDGDLYTIVTNADAKTQKGALIAMIKGTKSKDVEKILNKIPIEIRLKVKTVTKDFAKYIEKIARNCFSNIELIIDRFHVVQLINDVVQQKRIEHRWAAVKEENKAIKKNKKANKRRKKNKKYVPETCDNGDTIIQLLARSRYLLFKSKSKWTKSQKERAKILFEKFPDLESLYNLTMMFRNIYEKSITKEEAKAEYLKWYKKVEEKGFEVFNTAMNSIKNNEEEILNFFNERRTNCLAETFNSKIKAFRAAFRGVKDLSFFLYRVSLIFA